MRPITEANGHYSPRFIGESVPGEAAMIKNVVVGFEDRVGEPIVTDELPDILDWVQFG